MTKITKRQLYYLCQAHTQKGRGDYKRYLGSLVQRVKHADLQGEGQPPAASPPANSDPQEGPCTLSLTLHKVTAYGSTIGCSGACAWT